MTSLSVNETMPNRMVNTLTSTSKQDDEKSEFTVLDQSVSENTINELASLCKDTPLRNYSSTAATDHFFTFYDLSSKLFTFESAHGSKINEGIQSIVNRVLQTGLDRNFVLYSDCLYRFISDIKDIFSNIKELIKTHTHSIAILCNNTTEKLIESKASSKEIRKQYEPIASWLNRLNTVEHKIKYINFFVGETLTYASKYNGTNANHPLTLERALVFNFFWYLTLSSQKKDDSCCSIM